MEIESTWKHSFHRKNQSKFQPFSTVFWRQYSRSIWRLFNCFLTSVLKVNLTTFQLIFNVKDSPFKVKNIRKKVLHFQLCFDHLLTPLCNVNLTTFWRICAHGENPSVHTQSNWRQKVVIFWLVGQWLSFDWKLTAFLFSKQNLVVVWNFSETVCNSDYSWYLLSCKNKDHTTFH